MHACVHETSPSSEAGGISDDVSVKKAGQRATKSATAQRISSVQRGKNLSLYTYEIEFFHMCGNVLD